jgi:hypothetical protein
VADEPDADEVISGRDGEVEEDVLDDGGGSSRPGHDLGHVGVFRAGVREDDASGGCEGRGSEVAVLGRPGQGDLRADTVASAGIAALMAGVAGAAATGDEDRKEGKESGAPTKHRLL